MNKKEILKKVDILYMMWKKGKLGGEIMPEDENPHFDSYSKENYLYFTLPMALNYQRNSYPMYLKPVFHSLLPYPQLFPKA